MARNRNGFDESAADAAAEEAARKKRERDRKAAAAAAANGKGNGANPVTTASFEYETDKETGELIPISPSQPTYPGYVPPVVAYEPPEVVESTTDTKGEWDAESETYIPISDDAIDLLEETDTQPKYTDYYDPSQRKDEATTRTPMQVYLDLIEEGSFREGDIADLGLPPDQASVLRQAISDRNKRERENRQRAQDAYARQEYVPPPAEEDQTLYDKETDQVIEVKDSDRTSDTTFADQYASQYTDTPEESRIERLVRLVNDGTLTEGDVKDLGLNPQEQSVLTAAFTAKRKAAEAEEAGRRSAQEAFAAQYSDRDTEDRTLYDPEEDHVIEVKDSDRTDDTTFEEGYASQYDDEPVEDSASRIERLVGLINDGSLTEGDIADLGLDPHEQTILGNALRQKTERDAADAEAEELRLQEEAEGRSRDAYNNYEGRFLHGDSKPVEYEILNDPDLTEEQKQNLIERYLTKDDTPDKVEEVEGEDELSPRDRYGQKYRATVDFLNSGGDPAMVNWDELQSLADAAGVGDLLNKQTLIESGAAEYDKSQRPARQQKAYNDLIGRFMSGANVSEYEIATADLTDQQRSDLQSRFAEQERRRDEKRQREERDRERQEEQRLAQEEYEAEIERLRQEDNRRRIEEEQSAMANPTIDNEDKAERSSTYDNLSSQIYTAISSGDANTSQLLYQIETSGLADDEKARLKAMLPKPAPSLEQQAEEQLEQEAETKREEEYVALDEGKTIIDTDALVDIIDDVMSNMAGYMSEEDIVKLVSARLQGQNLFADSATLLNTVADVNRLYNKQFAGTRTRPLTFVERKDMEARERSDAVVTAAEMDASKTKDDLFAKFGISYEMQSKPEEAYWKAVKLGNASPSEAYRIFKLAGGMGAPPAGQNPNLTPEGKEEEDDDSISLFTITEEHGGYGHPFYADDVYNLKAKPGESEDEFWDRVQNAEWLTELKDPDTSASYTKLSPLESDAIVDKMITTLGQNGEDSVTLTNALNGLTRFQNSDEFTKNDLRGKFEDALLDALNSMGGEDLDEQKRLLRASAKEDYQDALEEANRYFLVNGLSGSGQEQRRFEELSSNHLKGLREIDMAINEKRNEYAAKQVTLLTDSLSQLANIDVSENKLGLEADDLEERGRQFDASLKQSKYQTEQELNIRNKELNMDETKFYETVRQFNKELGNRINEFAAQFGLSELETAASIRKVNTDIVNQTRELSNQIAMSWADITGIAGDMTGTINLNDLGIPAAEFSEEDRNLPPEYLAQTKIGKAIADSFSAMTGQQITLDQLKAIADGEDLTVEGMPTLESRQIATAITMQNLDRMNKYAAIADENDLELERFETAKEQADRQWYLTIGDVSETFGLNNDAFRDAKYQYDKMFDPLSADPDKNGTNNPDLIHAATEKAREIYLSSSGVAFGDDRYDEVNQDFREKWSQANDVFDNTHANQLKDIARQNKFEEDKFRRANEQADMQEEKYEEVWGALMGARDKDPTTINLYNSNRSLWNDTIDYINEYTDAGTTMTPEMAERYRQLVGKPIDPKMTELMAKYENVDMTVDQINSMVEDWSKLSPENKKRDDENEMQYKIRASAAMQTHHQTVDAASMVARMDRGELRVMDADSTHGIVSSLMENPPPGLFEHINATYGILNNDAKRDVLTSIVNATISNRQMEQYRDPETGDLEITYDDIGLDWINEDGSWKDDTNWFDDGRGWKSRAARSMIPGVGLYDFIREDVQSTDERMLQRFLSRSEPGGKLDGVLLNDLLYDDAYKNYRDGDGDFQIKKEGRAALAEFNGNFQATFGRNPTVREAMLFRATGSLDLERDDPSVGYITSINVRLVPENWIDNYNEPGQLEGIFALLNGGNVTPERAVARTSGWAKFGNIAGNIVASAAGAALGGGATSLGKAGGKAAAKGLGWDS